MLADAADVVAPLDVAWQDGHARLQLPLVTTGADGRSPRATFTVPPQTTSLVLTLQGPPTWQLTLAELTGPQGYVVVPKTWTDGLPVARVCLPCTNRIATSSAQASFLVPDAPQVRVDPGTWTFTALAYEATEGTDEPRAGPLDVHVDLLRRPPVANRAGVLDLNLCLTGARGITAAIALQHPRIQTALAQARMLLQQEGLDLGQVRAFDVPSDLQTVVHDGAADGDLTELLQSGANLPMGLNVFLVEAIYLGDVQPGAAVVRGLAGGVPGPPLEVGGPRAGLALSLALGPAEPDLLGRVLAHEICHVLGLFHSTEAAEPGQLPVQDTLPDTLEGDADNLMYWTQSENGAGKLTSQQADVLFANPWVQMQP